jgi:hypothetical protein
MNRSGLLTWIVVCIAVQGCAESQFQLRSPSSSSPAPSASVASGTSDSKKDSTADNVPSPNADASAASPAASAAGSVANSPSDETASPSASVSASPTETPSPTVTPTATPVVFDPNHIQIETSEKQWKKLSDEAGIRTFQEKNSAQDVVAFRGETTIPTSLTRIAAVLRDESVRKEWVDSLEEQKMLEKVNDFEQVEYNHSKVPWPFHDRDFVYRVKVKVDRGDSRSMLITMVSTVTPLQPEKDGIVRGEILHSFYYMKEIPGSEPKTEVLIEMALDPKGAIPMWMVNLTQKKWPHNTLLALKKIATKPDLVVPKEIEDYFNVSSKTGRKK